MRALYFNQIQDYANVAAKQAKFAYLTRDFS